MSDEQRDAMLRATATLACIADADPGPQSEQTLARDMAAMAKQALYSRPAIAPVDLRETVARAMADKAGLDWDHSNQSHKPDGTEYANHSYWLPLADAAILALTTHSAEVGL